MEAVRIILLVYDNMSRISLLSYCSLFSLGAVRTFPFRRTCLEAVETKSCCHAFRKAYRIKGDIMCESFLVLWDIVSS